MKVDLIDKMGSDLTVVNAARVSFDKEAEWDLCGYEDNYDPEGRTISQHPIFKLKDKDVKLINFLSKHNHWTPFAHCSLQFRIKAPIFVARQLGKHQVGLCLSGDSEITFIKKNKGISNGTYKRTLSDIWKMWSGQIKYQSGKKGKLNISKSNIRVFNEETNRFEISNIINVIDSGIKKVWLIVDEFGKSIKATEDHQFLTSNGWKPLKDINIEDFLVSPERGESFSEKENFRGNSEALLPKYTKVISKIYIGEEQCFDLTIDRIHNFIANGFVVHNCWNEVSRRYVDSEPEFYFPEKWRKRNPDKKQGSYEDEFVDLNFAEECQPKAVVEMCKNLYNAMLDMQVCPEQARILLPQNMYTEWYWSGTLYAFARICKLRTKIDTQKETRDIAYQIDNIARKEFPVSWEALLCK
jgi:thymidylate synthase ThyX